MLAQAAESVPGPGVLAGGLALEQKLWTGFCGVRCPAGHAEQTLQY